MIPRKVPFMQMAVATFLGVWGGFYIYRPFFEPTPKISAEQSPDLSKKQSETE